MQKIQSKISIIRKPHLLRCFTLYLLCSLPFIFSCSVQAEEDYTVGITSEMPYVDIEYKDNKIRIKRIQNENNKLTDSFAKTSRACPPFCITPMKIIENVETIGELEVIDFLKKEVKSGNGLLIDARLAKFYTTETLPGAVNIPFILFQSEAIKALMPLFGVKKEDNAYNFEQAKRLSLFCNGPWCSQSTRAIQSLLDFGYPANKIYYYRGGMQLWKLFSLTTVLPKPNNIAQ
ncbi:MAG: rhodanese-like domain-containing protein [Cocleimonas sp.]|nr:rhodanese-like domain-containing protein [Cocleimonas sp.]